MRVTLSAENAQQMVAKLEDTLAAVKIIASRQSFAAEKLRKEEKLKYDAKAKEVKEAFQKLQEELRKLKEAEANRPWTDKFASWIASCIDSWR